MKRAEIHKNIRDTIPYRFHWQPTLILLSSITDTVLSFGLGSQLLAVLNIALAHGTHANPFSP